MKKITAILLAALMVGGTLCGCTAKPEPTEPSNTGLIKPQVEENTVGAVQWANFQQAVTANQDGTALELATTLSESAAELFFGSASPIEKGAEFFAGFDDYRITGYREAAVYAPMIGSIPFMGYVFILEDGVTAEAFIKSLTDNCNPRWNVCVTADQTVAGAIGNRVFFLMCPRSMG